MTQEIGLYRRGTLFKSFPDLEQRSWAIELIWCVYILDRRWAVGTGLPYALRQSDIDLDLPEPVSLLLL
jgi:Fungal specific transcription factor domain